MDNSQIRKLIEADRLAIKQMGYAGGVADARYQVGERVTLMYTEPCIQNSPARISATVIKMTTKRAMIDAHMADGTIVRLTVKPKRLSKE